MDAFADLSVAESLEASLAAATHLEPKHAAAVAAARALAAKIDAWDTIVEWALEDAADSESRPKVPANDNTSLPSFLKYMEALQLVPAPLPRQTAKSTPASEPAAESGSPVVDDPAAKIVSLQQRVAGRKAR